MINGMKKFILTLMAAALMPVLAMAQCPTPATATATVTLKRKIPGLLDGNFSVSATKKVAFSQGNLQYTRESTSTPWEDGKFSFMEHQWDFIETAANPYCTADFGDKTAIGLFAWATSGWDNTAVDPTSVHYQPWSTSYSQVSSSHPHYSTNPSQYGPSNANVVGSTTIGDAESWSKEVAGNHPYENYDWGVYNSSDLGSGWRTLTVQEWIYLLNTRSGNRYAKANVHGVNGLILLPDGWTQAASAMSGTLSGINSQSGSFSAVSDANWTILANEGCVFLPTAGFRTYGVIVYSHENTGYYWTSSVYDKNNAYNMIFYGGGVNSGSIDPRHYGHAVRLVQDVE